MGDPQTRGDSLPPNAAASTGKRTLLPPDWLPWIVAALVILGLVAILTVLGGRARTGQRPNHSGVAAADPYAAKLAIADVKMSEASNFAGSKVTYLEGRLTNHGEKTLAGVTVDVVFRNALGEIAQKETLPVMLIRTREPYVDTEPVSAAPIEPGGSAEFRLIFDHVAEDWNQQYPAIQVTTVQAR